MNDYESGSYPNEESYRELLSELGAIQAEHITVTRTLQEQLALIAELREKIEKLYKGEAE